MRPSFVMMEEAPTIRLLNMHRIPATLRSYDISTIYVLQDKAQNDMLYGDKASRTILSNLSYQFFGKANDPETARYYEQFFARVIRPTKSISRAEDVFKSDTRITRGEREVSKVRSNDFFRLRQGEFISFADGADKRIHFKKPKLIRQLPEPDFLGEKGDFEANFDNIHTQVRELFGK
jgi:type IV secretory pathway TraG/TraD family ATPase VirD4